MATITLRYGLATLAACAHAYTLPAASARGASSSPAARCALPPRMAAGDYNVGVLAIQGGFAEHMQALERQSGVTATEVRTVEDLAGVDAIILPGGESTAHAKGGSVADGGGTSWVLSLSSSTIVCLCVRCHP